MLSRRAILAGALVLTTRAIAAEAPQPLAPEMERIVARGRLVVATSGADLAPFVSTGADGALVGDDIELAKGMATALGVDVAFERASTDAAMFDLLTGGEADLAIGRLS